MKTAQVLPTPTTILYHLVRYGLCTYISLKNSIICARLLTPKSQKQRSLINNYVSNFVNALKFNSFDKMKYFDIYTNAALELSKDKTFYEAWRINFYPSKFNVD